MIRLYTDAGLNTNLNIAAIAYVIRENDKTTTFVEQTPATDNHYLEFLALNKALKKIIEMNLSDILFIHSDSKILTDSITKRYSKHYQEILDLILEQLEYFPSYFVKHIADKDNKFAHTLVHQELLKLRH
ncbi:reverse transcriptase-like protein [Companilactobacillus baiquanensis]|uniref:Reverse transcriptase-like protein n=1 Tax=Companilactobacillus baiquanensis TaxID=2486005 RepID=A0ABW1UV00_9LACO|nr:reverse transcriptase-like protein [Companilactobacillus baiquanensis]